MKKIILTSILALMLCTLGSAQHIVRIDTSIVPYIQFDYQAWLDSNPNNRLTWDLWWYQFYRGSPQIPFDSELVATFLYGDQIQYNYIEGGANVHGIAVFSLAHSRDVYALNHGDSNTDWYPMDDVYLYDAMPDTLLLLETKPISRFAPYGPPLQYKFRSHSVNWATRCDSAFHDLFTGRQISHSLYNPNYILFDKPVHVEDSFYVGTSQKIFELLMYNNWCNMNGEQGSTMPNRTAQWWKRFLIGADGRIDSSCYPPPIKIKQRWTQPEWLENWWIAHAGLAASRDHTMPEGYVRNRWINRTVLDFTLILPLIEAYDTLWDYELPTCPQVEWFNVTGTRGDTTILRWQSADDLHAEWQLSYGPKGIDPDNGTLVDCRAASWRHIDSLHTRDSMSAWVRTVCRDEDYLRYSDWSHEVSWGGRDTSVLWTEQPQGNIRLEGLVRLTPNPATDEVTITSAYRLTGVEVYSMDGRLRYQAPAQGLTCRFAVQGWPRGTYLVLVQTAAGTSTKKLVVR